MSGTEPDAPEPAAPAAAPAPAFPEPEVAPRKRWQLSLVWLVPIVALLIGLVLVVRSLLASGPEIGIEFRSAEGIEPGRTEIRFKEVVVGHVKQLSLRPDRQKVRVTVALDKNMQGIAVEDTRFWIVRPRVGTAGISGLSTLFSGAYIGVDAGASQESQREFVGLDTPPLVLRGEPGRGFVLRGDDLGSLDVGSPVYHRRIRVGRVVGYSLDPLDQAVEVQVFIEAPNENLVLPHSRFWNASGVDVTLNASGLTVNAQSVASVLAGGVAFASAPGAPLAATPAPAGQRYTLFNTQRAALATEDGEPLRIRMVFNQSMRGMEAGAPVDLLGIELGTVRGFSLQGDAKGEKLPVEVTADLYPLRLGKLRERFAAPGAPGAASDRQLIKRWVERGLRAQVRNGNLLTGRLYVSLDFSAKAERRLAFDASADVLTLPTVPGTLSDLQGQVADIVAKLSRVKFDEIGSGLQQTLKSASAAGAALQTTLDSADASIRELTPEAQRTVAELRRTLAAAQQVLADADRNLADSDAPLQRSVQQTLAELQRAAQSLRVLADTLQRHPESLLRGKPADAEITRDAGGRK